MEKEEQSDTLQTAILQNRKWHADTRREETKQADWTRKDLVSPKNEEAVVSVETAEGVIIKREIGEIEEEDAAETRCKIPASETDMTEKEEAAAETRYKIPGFDMDTTTEEEEDAAETKCKIPASATDTTTEEEEDAVETRCKISASGTDTTTEDGDSIVCDEETIERNFKTHRSYIETCVKATDLIVFYDLFTAEQTKKFRQMFKTDPTGATAMAFDDIVKMENQPDKYRRLLSALKDAGYPKVERILKGLLLPVGSDHRQTIRKSAKDIFQSLCPKEVLPHLLSRDVISIDEWEEINAIERNSSAGAAALELLHVLPNRTRDWYRHFIASLIESNHEDLAETIDKDLVKKMKKAGTKDVTVHVSCPARPIDSRHRNREVNDGDMIIRHIDSEPEEERIDEDSDSSESVNSKVKKYDKMVTNKYCPTSWCKDFTGLHQMDVKGLGQESSSSLTYECSPCKFEGTSVAANYFCHDCSEYFCQVCKQFHSRMKVTRNHNIDGDFPSSKSTPMSSLQNEFCACEYQKVEMYCKTHVKVTCRSCEAENHAKCETCSIDDVTQNTIDNQVKSVGQAAEETTLLLETLLKDREDGLKSLNSLIKICKEFIYQCQRDIKGIIKNMDAPLVSQLNTFKLQQKQMFEDQIGACIISLRKLSADKTLFVNAMRNGDEKRKLISSLGLSNGLQDIQNVVSALTYGFEQPHIEFNRSDFLFDVLRDGQLCDLTFSAGGQVMTPGQ